MQSQSNALASDAPAKAAAPVDPRVVSPALDLLDRAAVAYLLLPLVIFTLGWFRWWAALTLTAAVLYSLRAVFARLSPLPTRSISRLQWAVAVSVAVAWSILGGTDHLVFANADWHLRDAVLHDLALSPWPIGYGPLDGQESLLRTTVAYFLPAALVGKLAGLRVAHIALLAWTALGASLFLLQMVSLKESQIRAVITTAALVVLFSGLDILGCALNSGLQFWKYWTITTHLEWWAGLGLYQYSSMTTQLFWVPNHAIGAWIVMGLMFRNASNFSFDALLPILLVAAALWSPLSALGLIPFMAWKAVADSLRERSTRLLDPRVWLPALLVGLVVAAYLGLDPAALRGSTVIRGGGESAAVALAKAVQFFLIEAGFIGIAIWMIRPSHQVLMALAVLALLPFTAMGPSNDLVMRVSIPSLVVLMTAATGAVLEPVATRSGARRRAVLALLLIIGAVTPFEEIARSIQLPAWPINLSATLVGASCSEYPGHYVARLGSDPLRYLLAPVHVLALGPQGPDSCQNPAILEMHKSGGWYL